MKARIVRFIACVAVSFSMLTACFELSAQDSSVKHQSGRSSKSHILIGTQFPLQFTAGYSYRFSNRVSTRAQAGIITKPYSGFIVSAMEALGMDKYLARIIKKTFQSGAIYGVGPNYHLGKNYVGVYGQYLHLKGGGIKPADALSLYFKKDFTELDISGLPVFEFSMQSNMVNAGVLFGRQFQLRNPRFAVNGEVGLSKIVASNNNFSSNRSIVDRIPFIQNLYKEIDTEIQDAYWKYGFVPTINLYLVYHL